MRTKRIHSEDELIAATNPKTNKFDRILICTGTAIAYAYLRAFGKDSCMTGPAPHARGSIEFYTLFPKRIALVLHPARGAKRGYARAILWTADNGEKCIDRCYGTNGVGEAEIRDWACANDYHNIYDDPDDRFAVTLSTMDAEDYEQGIMQTPYFDSFYMYGARGEGRSSVLVLRVDM